MNATAGIEGAHWDQLQDTGSAASSVDWKSDGRPRPLDRPRCLQMRQISPAASYTGRR